MKVLDCEGGCKFANRNCQCGGKVLPKRKRIPQCPKCKFNKVETIVREKSTTEIVNELIVLNTIG